MTQQRTIRLQQELNTQRATTGHLTIEQRNTQHEDRQKVDLTYIMSSRSTLVPLIIVCLVYITLHFYCLSLFSKNTRLHISPKSFFSNDVSLLSFALSFTFACLIINKILIKRHQLSPAVTSVDFSEGVIPLFDHTDRLTLASLTTQRGAVSPIQCMTCMTN